MDAKKKKRAKKAQRRHEKDKEIARRVCADENQSGVEAELESEEPTEMGGDASTSEDEGDQGIVTTSMERREPAAASINGGWNTKRRNDDPASRKHVASLDAAVELEAKQSRSPRPLEAPLASHSPASSLARHVGRSEERARTPASSGSARARDPQQGDAPLVAPVGVPRAGGHGHSWADREPVGSAPPLIDTRGRGS